MSTYNGERYLKEQLESIFAQKDASLHLLIRDDGSSDSTLKILQGYKNKYPSKIDIIEGRNIGWRKSFFTLAAEAQSNYTSYDYFSFADQDDIWLPGKLSRGVGIIMGMPEGPNLYCSNLTIYKNGTPTGILRNATITPTYKSCLIRNYATGCTMVFNRRLLELVCRELPKIKIAHDYWFYMVACLCGTVVIDDESFIWYRIHGSNQVGFKSGFIEIWKRRLQSMSNLLNGHHKEIIAKELFRIHEESMHKEAKEAINKLLRYKLTISNRLSLLLDSGYTYNKLSNDFWLKLKILSGRL